MFIKSIFIGLILVAGLFSGCHHEPTPDNEASVFDGNCKSHK